MIFKPYTLEETVIEKALHTNECERWIEAFIPNLGHPLWGWQSMHDLASLMRKAAFLIPDANSCIDCEPHKGWPRFVMNASIHLSHSFVCSAFSKWPSLLTYRVWKSPKSETKFWKECIKAKKWKTPVLCLQNYTHKIVHSSAMHYQNLIIIHECSKKLLKMKNSKSFFLTPSTKWYSIKRVTKVSSF